MQSVNITRFNMLKTGWKELVYHSWLPHPVGTAQVVILLFALLLALLLVLLLAHFLVLLLALLLVLHVLLTL